MSSQTALSQYKSIIDNRSAKVASRHSQAAGLCSEARSRYRDPNRNGHSGLKQSRCRARDAKIAARMSSNKSLAVLSFPG
ncbi:hypothetical protein VTL71DRAFT_5524, partial [Oculimacula yallundae]